MSTPDRVALHVDWTRCDGRGLCAELLPATFARDPWGYPIAVTDPRTRGQREPEVADSDARRVARAVRACPRSALSVVEVAPPSPTSGR
ncbi:ferredoxin [Williamsia deligens]|uniref:Ferredoxin n=1 Tax=Williamsia deligens TaxID=321325 RepID=A0ABW3G4Z2_9NOCA|nr:ferredoxin [Williamsia deligens]